MLPGRALYLLFTVAIFVLFDAEGNASGRRMILLFDENSRTEAALDMGSETVTVPFSRNLEAEISSKEKRFGEGSLLLVSDATAGVLEIPFDEARFSSFADPVTQLTVTLWVRLAAVPEHGFTILQRAYANGSGTPGYFAFTKHPTLGLRFIATNHLPVRSSETALGLEANEWVHVALTYNQGEVRFYKNGEPLPLFGKTEAGEIPPLAVMDHKARFRFLAGLPAGSHVDDIGLFLGSAFDDEAIREIANRGLKAFLENGAAAAK